MSTDAGQIYPFRHLERRFLVVTMIGLLAAGVAVILGVSTIDGFKLIAVCSMIGGVAGVGFWLWLWRTYRPVAPQIVQGPKRFAMLATTVGFCSAAAIAAAALVLNRQIHIGPIRAVEATVLYVGRVVGPKVYGWDARFAFEGSSYQMISAEHARVASSAQLVRLELQKGALGYEYIVAVRPKL